MAWDENLLVLDEIVYFKGEVARHIVTTSSAERDRIRLFLRPVKTGQARHVDEAGNRYFSEDSSWSRKQQDEKDAGGIFDVVPEHEHASFEDFLRHVGYRWRQNLYRAA